MKCKLNGVTVNLPADREEHYIGGDHFSHNLPWQEVLDEIATHNPSWTSMVIVVTNPEAKS